MMKQIKLKLNVDLNGKKAGDVIDLRTDSKGNVKDSYWSRRIKDAEIDNCVEIVKQKSKTQSGEK